MPRLNSRGAVTPQIGYSHYDDLRFIFQDCSSGVCRIVLSDGTVIAEAGTNILLANGNGVWAYVDANTGHGDPTTAVYHDSFGRTRANSFPIAIGPDGAVCVKPHSNQGAVVIEPDGSEWVLSTEDAQDVQLLGARQAIWTVGGIVHSTLPIIGNPGTPVYWPRVTEDRLLQYQALDGRLVLGGHVVAPASDRYFYPDVRLLNGLYIVCWSPNQADTDAQFKRLSSVQLAALPLVDAVTPPTPPVPPVPPPEKPPVSNQLETVERIRAKYPTPLGSRHWEFLVEVAQATGAQLFRKDGGDHVFVPPINQWVSMDVIGRGALGDVWVDILKDAEGEAIAAWSENSGAAGEYLDVSGVALPGASQPPTPPPTPPPTVPPSADLAAILKRLDALEARPVFTGKVILTMERA